MTSEQDGQDEGQDAPERSLPEHPEGQPAETVDALEEQHAGDDPDDGERVTGDDVAANPDTDELDGLPGPSPDEPAEPAGLRRGRGSPRTTRPDGGSGMPVRQAGGMGASPTGGHRGGATPSLPGVRRPGARPDERSCLAPVH